MFDSDRGGAPDLARDTLERVGANPRPEAQATQLASPDVSLPAHSDITCLILAECAF